MKIFIIGIAGGVGRRLADQLISRGHDVSGLVRREEQLEPLERAGIYCVLGDLSRMSLPDLSVAVEGTDVIVFSAGAGGRDGNDATTAVDGLGPGKVASAARLAGVKRFVLVSVFPEALRGCEAGADFEHYMNEKKLADVDIASRDLDWVIVRPSSLKDGAEKGRISLGYAEIHGEIDREDVAATIAAIIAEPRIKRVILEMTGGSVPIGEAVAKLVS